MLLPFGQWERVGSLPSRRWRLCGTPGRTRDRPEKDGTAADL
jgi:hypothetical protein